MNKISGQACNIIKKRLQSRYLPVNFAKFSRTPPDDYFEKFTLARLIYLQRVCPIHGDVKFQNNKTHEHADTQKQPSRGVLNKRYSENMQQIYIRTPMPKCDFNKVAKQLYQNHTLA